MKELTSIFPLKITLVWLTEVSDGSKRADTGCVAAKLEEADGCGGREDEPVVSKATCSTTSFGSTLGFQ